MKKVCIFLLSCVLSSSCSVAPQKIEYGKDVCSYCDMAIVDRVHAAEFVTTKGKAFKFDAIECLIHDLTERNETDMAFVLVTDFLNPEVFINATEAMYLISEKIKSPMGANLTAFSTKEISTYKNESFISWKNVKKIIRKNTYLNNK